MNSGPCETKHTHTHASLHIYSIYRNRKDQSKLESVEAFATVTQIRLYSLLSGVKNTALRTVRARHKPVFTRSCAFHPLLTEMLFGLLLTAL